MAVPNVRALIVDLTPPILLRFAQRLRRRMRHLVRDIRFRTFVPGHRAPIAGVVCGDGYDDDEYVGLIVTNKLRTIKSEPYDYRSGYLILPLVVSQLLDQRLTVLDFGGGAATGLFSILDHVVDLDLAKFSYVLVETPAMCRAVRNRIVPVLPQLPVTIVEDIPTSLAGLLIVNISSSIQYIPAYRETLDRIVALSPQLIIISQTQMTNGPSYVHQELHPYQKIASRIFNRSEFIAEMESLGYACIFTVDHSAPRTDGNGPLYRTSMIFRLHQTEALAT
jgi:putative methyltransferase (TIGR04325 family)